MAMARDINFSPYNIHILLEGLILRGVPMKVTEKQVLERLERRKEIVTARIDEFRRWLRHEKLFIQLMESHHSLPPTTTIPLIEYEKALAKLERTIDDTWSEYNKDAVDVSTTVEKLLHAQHI